MVIIEPTGNRFTENVILNQNEVMQNVECVAMIDINSLNENQKMQSYPKKSTSELLRVQVLVRREF